MRVAVIGASGYTGAEALRLIVGHPYLEVGPLVGRQHAGKPISEVLPHLTGLVDDIVQPLDIRAIKAEADLVVSALPHGASAEIVASLRDEGLPVFDLSADFRLEDRDVYRTWYGDHGAPQWFGRSVYGLVELYRERLREADLVAVPGCYPTASILALAPLISEKVVDPKGIVVDAKSGVSGAGRGASEATHFPHAAEGIKAYKVAGQHRHTPEIEQELSKLAGTPLALTFTPHLAPMTRGILATAYAMATAPRPADSQNECILAAQRFYASSPSVVVLDPGQNPDTRAVRGSNRAHLAYHFDPRTGRVIAQAAIDNLIKGAAGQAIQCINVRFGWDEADGLSGPAVWP